ncbi:hypothetical protein NQ314_003183 [Rhamnusium bicolor]|uniref:Uncharacterized protein n=1 Tax=Rhamnusium bicolor TaxID=1586634 RepID=A0AAV8ZN12_9CUCU|nr:hypothetical protein NQ314_003183 [Rhamnusium bicolor]
MSGQQSQSTPARVPKSSPNLVKQGPMKATIPMSSVLKQTSNLKSGHSPAVSPTYYWKNRTSPDHSSGQRSPGSSAYKDKTTQTDESDWLDPRKIHSISETDDKIEKLMIRQKIRNTKESNGKHGSPGDNTLNTSSQTLSSCIFSPTFKANPVCIPLKPLPKSSIRNSVEGLNQEIERIVLKTGGHRAPLAELFRSTRSRSVNTQTPQDFGGSCHSSGDSQGSSPDQEASKLGTSPHINKFLAREPPDGCEKVHLKSMDERKLVPHEHAPQPCTFKLKPSLGSAFQILQPNISNTVDRDLPLVPPQQELN